MLVLATLTALVIAHPAPLPGEIPYIRWLQQLGSPAPALAEFVRTTTGTEGALVVGAVPAIWLVRRHGRAGARAVSIALVALLIVQPVFKELVDRPRPTAAQVELRADHVNRSFPSGHSLGTTTIWGAAAGLAWRRRHRLAASAALGPIVATGLGSGVQGVHWPTDAIAGTLVGSIAAGMIVSVLDPPSPAVPDVIGTEAGGPQM